MGLKVMLGYLYILEEYLLEACVPQTSPSCSCWRISSSLPHSLHFFIRLEATGSDATGVTRIRVVSLCLFDFVYSICIQREQIPSARSTFFCQLLDAFGSNPVQTLPITYRYRTSHLSLQRLY